MIAPGELRHRVTLQKRGDGSTADAFGQLVSGWINQLDMRCAVNTSGGRELFRAQQVTPEVTMTVRVRYRALFDDAKQVIADYRLLHKGRVLDIKSVVNEDSKNQWVVLGCVETESGEFK
jgi:SPP1 family predicted phage head-tail adaptor